MASVTIAAWLRSATDALADTSDSARLDAELLLAFVLKKDRIYLYTWPEKLIPREHMNGLSSLLTRRRQGEPMAYITGEREFWSLSLLCNPSTLIPRSDTETLVEKALAMLPSEPARILDLGTGTGAIALAIARERPDCHVDGVDLSVDAVELANKNKQCLQIPNVNFFQSDWFSNVNKRYDLIVSNPPYIDADDPHLIEGDVRYEPSTALVAKENGLADIKIIAASAKSFLSENGMLLIEHGYQQKNAVAEVFMSEGYLDVGCEQDLAGRDRVSFGKV